MPLKSMETSLWLRDALFDCDLDLDGPSTTQTGGQGNHKKWLVPRKISLKRWGTWDTTCGHKAKEITPTAA